MGRDETISISDVLTGMFLSPVGSPHNGSLPGPSNLPGTDRAVSAEMGDFHLAMEKKLRML